MCDTCLHSPCLSGCPNEIVPIIGVCKRCRNDIEYGMEYLDHDSGFICAECLDDMPLCELMSMFGYELQTAGKEE